MIKFSYGFLFFLTYCAVLCAWFCITEIKKHRRKVKEQEKKKTNNAPAVTSSNRSMYWFLKMLGSIVIAGILTLILSILFYPNITKQKEQSDTSFDWITFIVCIGIACIVFLLIGIMYKSTRKKDEGNLFVQKQKETKKDKKVVSSTKKFRWKPSGWIMFLIVVVIASILIWWNWGWLHSNPKQSAQTNWQPAQAEPKTPQKHLLHFGENHMKPGEIWYFLGDSLKRHYASKEDGCPILTIQSESPDDFYQQAMLKTVNGVDIENEHKLLARYGQIYCSYTEFVTVDREATIIVTKVN